MKLRQSVLTVSKNDATVENGEYGQFCLAEVYAGHDEECALCSQTVVYVGNQLRQQRIVS